MDIQINGTTRTFEASTLTVGDLIERLDVATTDGVAIAVGNAVVPQSQWNDKPIRDGEAVEIIRATQGG